MAADALASGAARAERNLMTQADFGLVVARHFSKGWDRVHTNDGKEALESFAEVHAGWLAAHAPSETRSAKAVPTWMGASLLQEAQVRAQIWAAELVIAGGDHRSALMHLDLAKEALQQPSLQAAQLRAKFVGACYSMAHGERAASRSAIAAELLALAVQALRESTAEAPYSSQAAKQSLDAAKARLLRQQAACYLDLCEPGLAHPGAAEAVELEEVGTLGRAASLRTLLSVLGQLQVAGGTKPGDADIKKVRKLAMELMEHPTLSVASRLAVCTDLANGIWPTALACECLAALGRQLAPGAPEQANVRTARFRLAASCTSVATDKETKKALRSAMADEEAMSQCPALCESACLAMTTLARAELCQGRFSAAGKCFGQIALRAADAGSASNARLAVSACHLSCGEHDDSKREAEAALELCQDHLGALQLLLLDAVRRGQQQQAQDLAETISRHPAFTRGAPGLLHSLQYWNDPKRWEDALCGPKGEALDCWLPSRRLTPVVPACSHETVARAIRARVQLIVVLQQPSAQLTSALSDASTLLSLVRAPSSASPLAEETTTGVMEEIYAAAGAAYARAALLQDCSAWAEAAAVLGSLRETSCSGLDRARCTAQLAAALLRCQPAGREREEQNSRQQILTLAQEAACELDRDAESHNEAHLQVTSMLRLIETETFCHVENGSALFAEHVKGAQLDGQTLLAMARVCPRTSQTGREVAAQCLQLLGVAEPSQGLQVARGLLSLLPGGEHLAIARGMANAARNTSGDSSDRCPAIGEAEWLLALCWHTSCCLWLAGRHAEGVAWLDVAQTLCNGQSKRTWAGGAQALQDLRGEFEASLQLPAV